MELDPANKLKQFLSGSFIVVGHVKYLKQDFALTKVAKFVIGGEERHIISEVGIDTYNALPCYCPFLIYKVVLRIIPGGCSIYKVERVLHCAKRYPDGIPLQKLLALTPRYGSKKLKLGGTLDKIQSLLIQTEDVTPDVPTLIKTKKDIQDIPHLDDQTKVSLIKLCKPCFRDEVFFDLICYFPYSFLKRYTDSELADIREKLLTHPPLACFRSSFSSIVKERTPDGSISERLLTETAQYVLNRWMYFTSGEEKGYIEYSGSCPLWNIQMMKYFCEDHGIDIEPMLPLLRVANFIYIACERSKAMKGTTLFNTEQFKMTQDIINYFTEHNIMVKEHNQMMYLSDSQEDRQLMKTLKKIKNKVEVIDIQTNVEEMIEITLHDIVRENLKTELQETIIITPHFSNALYLQAKLERGFNFQRQRPKRGRKPKIQSIDIQKVNLVVEENPSNIYDVQTWLKLLKRTDIDCVYEGCKHFILWNTQDMTARDIIDVFRFIDEADAIVERVTIAGNTNMWVNSIPPVFNVLAKRMDARIVKSKVNPTRYKELYGMFLNNVTMKKKQKAKKTPATNSQQQIFSCSPYENEELLSEFLSEWMEKNAKWKSKTILFTNEELMVKISIGTNEIGFRLGANSNCLYIDSTVYVEEIGFFGVIKKATVLGTNYTWRDIVDQNIPLFPFNHRYILRIEDYYTKYIRLIDTSKYICRNPLFSLMKSVSAIPFEVVLLIVDHTTTKQDIARAAEISNNIFTVYYKKGLNAPVVIEHEMLFPETGLDCKLSK